MDEQASRFVGSIPENYDAGLGPFIFFDYARDLAHRVAAVEPTSVLELAAGTGILSRALGDANSENCRLVVSDLNAPMLEVAKSKFAVNDQVNFDVADATSLQYEDSSFDAVACQFGVMFFPDKLQSYREVHRVLKTGGRYVFNVWTSWAENPFARIAHEAVQALFPSDPPGFYKVPFSYHDPEAISDSLLSAGFDSVTTEHVAITSKITSASVFARGLIFGNPVFEEITLRGGDPEEVFETVKQTLETQLGDSMPLQALVVQALKT